MTFERGYKLAWLFLAAALVLAVFHLGRSCAGDPLDIIRR